MPRDSNGNATITRQIAVSGQTVLAEQVNTPFADTQSMLNLVFWRDGISPATGNFNLNGFRITNAANASGDQDFVTLNQLNAVSATVSSARAPTGTVQAFRRKTAPAGWIKENGGTIGNDSSGATTRANADTLDLFTLLWGEFTNTELPIQNSSGAASTRGASAAADFSANKRMPLFDSRTRFLRGADDGLGYDAGLTVGAAQEDILKSHTHTGNTNPIGDHVHQLSSGYWTVSGGGSTIPAFGTGAPTQQTAPSGAHGHSFTTDATGSTLETRPRSSVALICIKL